MINHSSSSPSKSPIVFLGSLPKVADIDNLALDCGLKHNSLQHLKNCLVYISWADLKSLSSDKL